MERIDPQPQQPTPAQPQPLRAPLPQPLLDLIAKIDASLRQ